MSIASTVRAFPTLLRVGVAGAVAYRAEMLIWVLSTTMPLVMLALWSAVAMDGPVGRFGQDEFVAYFLATFIVRQLTGSWAAWEMNYEVRTGQLAQKLLRPIHPLAMYASENLGALPMRVVVAIPVALISLFTVGASQLPADARMWLLWLVSITGAWLITLFVNLAIGSLRLFMESSLNILDVWFTLFMAFSGYIIPIELFPDGLRAVINWLPWRYQIGFPVEVMTGGLSWDRAFVLLGAQWTWVLIMFGLTVTLWRRGLSKFAAYGG